MPSEDKQRTVNRFQEDRVWSSGKFTVDSEGHVWRSGRRAENRVGGYLQVKVMISGTRYYTCAHRLVWCALVGPIPHGMVVNHKNGKKDDNRPENLEITSYSGNTKHAYRTGLMDENGERNPAAKLTDQQVAEIRESYIPGSVTQKQLADKYGVQHQSISRIIRGTRRPKQSGQVLAYDLRHSVCERDSITGRFLSQKTAPHNDTPELAVAG